MEKTIINKYCGKCKTIKPINEFALNKGKKDGYQSWCKKCLGEARNKWEVLHPESSVNRRMKFRHNHPGYSTEKVKEWWMSHPRERKEADKKYRKKHRMQCQYYTENRRALKKNNGGIFTKSDWFVLLDESDRRCQKCGCRTNLTLDHIVPLILGGRHEKSNTQILCRSCNSSKGINVINYRKSIVAFTR